MSWTMKSVLLQLVSEHDPRTILGWERFILFFMTHVLCDSYLLMILNGYECYSFGVKCCFEFIALILVLVTILHQGSDMIWPIWCFLLTTCVSWCWFWIMFYYFKGVCLNWGLLPSWLM
jgi:hypothetical protein